MSKAKTFWPHVIIYHLLYFDAVYIYIHEVRFEEFHF